MEKESEDDIFSDFKKAFYTVSHYSLLGKMKKMGGYKIILNIVSYFLLHRSIKVKIGNNYSETQNIPLVFLRVQYWGHHCWIEIKQQGNQKSKLGMQYNNWL